MKLIIDSREKSLFTKHVIRKSNKINVPTEIKWIEVGDYVIGDTCFEAKSASDFMSSVMNRRIWTQIDNMDKHFDNNFVVIYGSIDEAMTVIKYMKLGTNVARAAFKNKLALQFKGAIGRLRLDYGINVIWRDTAEDAAEELVTLAKMIPVKRAIVAPTSLKRIATDDVRIDMLTSVKGLSKNKAKDLLDKYGCIMEIGDCSRDELTIIKGLGNTVADRVLNILNSEKKVKQ